jgi:endonuclease/exonuclease/phosphatase family metal-dependent hydrolase
VRDWLREAREQGPVILCGDFNAGGRSQAYRLLSSSLRDVQEAKRPRSTFFGRYPILRIDHILVSEGIEVVGCAVSNSRLARIASDHLPLLADLRLPAAGDEGADSRESAVAESGG